MQLPPQAFMSYTRFDDEHNTGYLSALREQLSNEVRGQSGEKFAIFQDTKDIKLGQQFAQRIAEALESIIFFIPILTPSFFKSEYCREELRQFLMRENQLQRHDLILPIYYIESPLIEDPAQRANDDLAQIIAERQRIDWREFRFEPLNAPSVRKQLAQMAIHIRDVMQEVQASDAFPIVSAPLPAPASPSPATQAKLTPGKRSRLEIEDAESKQVTADKSQEPGDAPSEEREQPDDPASAEEESDPVFRWLQRRGFRDNPFTTTSAEEEEKADLLKEFFVRTKLFDILSGDPRQPESLVLFAGQGHGKTSYRLAIARHVRDQEVPALVIHLTDFSSLLPTRPTISFSERDMPSIRQRMKEILTRKTLEILTDCIKRHEDKRTRLEDDEDMFASFCALKQLYVSPKYHEKKSPKNVSDWVKYYKERDSKKDHGFIERLRDLSGIVFQAGFVSIYVLINGIDEWTTASNTQIFLLRTFLDSPGVLQERGFAFKFFLPVDLEKLMKKGKIKSFDWIHIHQLNWQTDELRKVLEQRLVSFCSGVESFSELCDAGFNVDDEIVNAANRSPRKLIDIVKSILEAHCTSLETFDERISENTIRQGISEASHLVL